MTETPNPQAYARLGGAMYLLIIGIGIVGELVTRAEIVASGNAAATAENLVRAQGWWRAGIASNLVMHLCDVGVMLALYVLLRPVNRNLARLAVLFNLIQTAVMVTTDLVLVVPLLLLGEAPYLAAFTLQQRQTMAYVAIRLQDYGFGFGLVFFGVTCLVTGQLIRKAAYLPRLLGVLMQLAGVCYVVNSFALVLSPAAASQLVPYILLPPFVAELSLASWLLVKGVNQLKWDAIQANA
jgi:hypothetical protein